MNKIIAYYKGSMLVVENPDDVLVSRELKIKKRLRELRNQGIEYALVDVLPDDKYRDAWKIDDSAVVIDEKKSIEISRTRAYVALDGIRKDAISEGRRKSLRDKIVFKGLSEKDEAKFRDSRTKIARCEKLWQLEGIEEALK